ncbi:hypothetical protein COCMIDRAFT_27943 [Bipolaris oryzae ATCC 44560]|uniref:Uncharacterized protein n=1 Tax=Bipolaris oryzae ATCC 44560 TaxID=930090 RepID=W6Z7Q9_COCMI|nr:uncharacterized protein COCMIDRAFT_27943 [Bipolaris oryzae ATCC 44560]EUC43614.1 hypothetical protein COCMIDRAFT_27943 [Bipolaris oryzae ATCC 44560]
MSKVMGLTLAESQYMSSQPDSVIRPSSPSSRFARTKASIHRNKAAALTTEPGSVFAWNGERQSGDRAGLPRMLAPQSNILVSPNPTKMSQKMEVSGPWYELQSGSKLLVTRIHTG